MIYLFFLVKPGRPNSKLKISSSRIRGNFGHNETSVIFRIMFDSWIEAIKFTLANKEEIYAVTDSKEEMNSWSPYNKL